MIKSEGLVNSHDSRRSLLKVLGLLLPHGFEPALVVRVSIDQRVDLSKDGLRNGARRVLREDSNAWLETLEVSDCGSFSTSDKVHAVVGKPLIHNRDLLTPEVGDPRVTCRLVTSTADPGRTNVNGILLHVVFNKVDYGVDGPGNVWILSVIS